MTGQGRSEGRGGGRGLAVDALVLVALTSYAIAEQYFDPISRAPDFLIEQGVAGFDIVAFALVLIVVPPAALVLVEVLAGLVHPRLRTGLHLAFVAALAALIVWQRLNDITAPSPGVAMALGLAGGALLAWAYARIALVRTYLAVCSVAAIVFLVAFLVVSPVRTLAFGGDGDAPRAVRSSGAPVVMVVFDELPGVALMDRGRRIDPVRYPAFARLAAGATWYRNATSVADATPVAIPSILTGLAGPPDAQGVAADHPRSLFTLLGGSYRMDVTESFTELCGAPACPERDEPSASGRLRRLLSTIVSRRHTLPEWVRGRAAAWLAPPSDELADDSREYHRSVRRHLADPTDSASFLRGLRPGRDHTLDFVHLLLPHRPWSRLPSGQGYPTPRPEFGGTFYGRWPRDPWVAKVAYQRFLLQLGAADRVLGQIVRRLRASGRYDRSLIVITADHGESFRPGEKSRTVTRGNVAEVSSVPLIVKLPGQRTGHVDDGYVESTDVMPTIASALGVRVPWRTDGRPAGANSRGPDSRLTVDRHVGGGAVVAAHSRLAAGRDAALRRQRALFGDGRDPLGLYRIGPEPRLVGMRVDRIPKAPRGAIEATLDLPALYRAVDPAGPVVPANVTGLVRGAPARKRAIAVVLDGRVAATAWTVTWEGKPEYFTAMVPPRWLRAGRNRVQVFAIEHSGGAVRLSPLG